MSYPEQPGTSPNITFLSCAWGMCIYYKMGLCCTCCCKWCWFLRYMGTFLEHHEGYPKAQRSSLRRPCRHPASLVQGYPGLSVWGTPLRPPAPRARVGGESLQWPHCRQPFWNIPAQSAHFQHRAGAQVSLMCPKFQRL